MNQKNKTFSDSKENSSPSEMLRSRKVALDLLTDVLERKQPLDLSLEINKDMQTLPARDKAFVRMIVATTLRRKGQVDDFIRRAMDSKKEASPSIVQNILRIGATQIAYMNVPDYAVVNTSVEMATQYRLHKQKGLVNAVLRRIAREYRDWELKQDETRFNVPSWLMESWIKAYDLKVAAKIAQASLIEAPLDISIKNQEMAEYWSGTLEATVLPTGSLRRQSGGQVYELSGFNDGEWWVQDASATIPAQLFGDIQGETVIDLCAAPGGKTAQLASMGAKVIAVDRSAKRMNRLKENMARLGFADQVNAEIVDGSVWQPKESVKSILLDAPCSATGTVRRHPDLMYIKKQDDVKRLSDLQYRLLEHAINLLETGGTLIYCTCSLQKEEGEEQIEKVLGSGLPVKRVPIVPAEVGGQESFINEFGDIRVLPFYLATQGGMDGFFISRLQKI
jgi:16S rRNA (cytosine967-C5)-methyltransferase